MSLLSNVIIAPTLLHEPLIALDLVGLVLAMVGAVAVVSSVGPSGHPALDPPALWAALLRPTFVVYACTALTLGLALLAVCSSPLGHRSLLAHVGVCGVFGGFTVLATKGVSSLLVQSLNAHSLQTPLLYVLLVVLLSTAILQLVYLNRALQRFDSRHVIPTQFVLFTVSTIVGSSILYRDLDALPWTRLAGFGAGCVCTFLGVFVLTCDLTADEAPPPAAPPAIVVEEEGPAPHLAASPPLSTPVDMPETSRPTRHSRSQSLGSEFLRPRPSLRHLATTLFSGTAVRSAVPSPQERASLRAMQRRRLRSNPSILAEWRGMESDAPMVLGLSPGRHLLVSGGDTPLSQSPPAT